MNPKSVYLTLIGIVAIAALVLGIISIVKVSGRCNGSESFVATVSPSVTSDVPLSLLPVPREYRGSTDTIPVDGFDVSGSFEREMSRYHERDAAST